MTRFAPLSLFILTGLLLAACASPADRAREQALLDRTDLHHCLDLGFEEGTEAYGNCRLKLKEIRAAQKEPNNPSFGVGIGIGIGL